MDDITCQFKMANYQTKVECQPIEFEEAWEVFTYHCPLRDVINDRDVDAARVFGIGKFGMLIRGLGMGGISILGILISGMLTGGMLIAIMLIPGMLIAGMSIVRGGNT